MDDLSLQQRAAWAAAFAAVDTLLRAFALGLGDPAWPWTIPGSLIVGFVLIHLASRIGREVIARGVIAASTLCLLFFDAVVYRYEAVQGRFPDAHTFLYIAELAPAWSSVEQESPLATIAIVVIGTTILTALPNRLPEANEGPWPERIASATLIGALLFSGIVQLADIFRGPAFWGTRIPIVWVVRSILVADPEPVVFRPDDVDTVLRASSGEARETLGREAPFCAGKAPSTEPNGRSVIVVVLESVGNRTMNAEYQGAPVVPNVQRIANDGVFFDNVWAIGATSDQALPALYAGLPPSSDRMVSRLPQPRFVGLPNDLAAAGYATTYFHGGDLSFLQQRSFLRQIGFEEIVELEPDEPMIVGWGVPDHIMLERFEQRLAELRGQQPYFAAFAMLTPHHPFEVPNDWDSPYARRDKREKFYDTLHYSDHHLGELYDWYRENEYDRGTILVVVSDHAAHYHVRAAARAQSPIPFEIPVIVVGKDLPASNTSRRGSQLDVPTTIRQLLGMERGRCEVGASLFAEEWPEDRLTAAVDSNAPRWLHVRGPEGRWVRDLEKSVFESRPEAAGGAAEVRTARFSEALQRLTRWAAENDAIAPPATNTSQAPAAVARVSEPIFIAHRGQSQGPAEVGVANRRETIRAAIDDGFEWIEVDVQITGDDALAVLHDVKVETADGEKLVAEMSLAELRALPKMASVMTLDEVLTEFGDEAKFLFEAKSSGYFDYDTKLSLQLMRTIRKHELRDFYIDSFATPVISSLRNYCADCKIGWDAPYKGKITPTIFELAHRLGVDFILAHHSVVDADLIRRTHAAGLKIFVYTVNEQEYLQELDGELPDGVITDYAAVGAE